MFLTFPFTARALATFEAMGTPWGNIYKAKPKKNMYSCPQINVEVKLEKSFLKSIIISLDKW
jgi:hypothetical protein